MSVLDSKYEKTKKYDEPLYKEPHSTQECFSVEQIDETGIFVLPNSKYSKCFYLSDINFAGMTEDEQKLIIIKFSRVLCTISCQFSYYIANEFVDENVFHSTINYPLQNDEKDVLRGYFNEVIDDKAGAKQGLYQTIYFIVTVTSDSIKEARMTFASMESSLRSAFIQIGINGMAGSSLRSMDINTRMQKWYNFSHLGIQNNFVFDYYQLLKAGKDWKNIVVPEKLEFFADHYVMNDVIWGRNMYVSKFPQTLVADFMSEISNINCSSFVAVNNIPIDIEGYKQEVNKKHSSVGMQIENEKKRNRNNNDFLADASEKLLNEKSALVEIAKKTDEGDEHYYNSTVLINFVTTSKEELDKITDKIHSIANVKNYEMKPCFNMQRQGLNSSFLFGVQEIKKVCNFTAPCLAMFMPYKTQELNDANGLWYGINQLSQNSIIADRKKHCFHGMFLGQTRKGKSVFAKCEILGIALNHPEEQIIIIDPQNEYRDIAKLPGINGEILSFDTQKKEYLNPLDVNFEGVDYTALQDIIDEKIDFIITILSSCINRKLDSEEQGIINDVVEKIYNENYAMRKRLNGETSEEFEYQTPTYMRFNETEIKSITNLTYEQQEKEYSPLLQDIYQELKDMDNEVANKLAKFMNIFVNGSLNLFNHRTNVDISNKFLVLDISLIKENLRTTAELVMLEVVKKKLKINVKSHVFSNIYIDEFHELLRNPVVAEFVIKLWKEAGKLKGILTAITQNMTDLINNSPDSDKLKAILSNTEYFAILNQSTIDRELLEKYLPSISHAMYNFVEGAEPGTGILKMGTLTVPFNMRMNTKSKLYEIVNTDGNNVNSSI